MIAFRVNPRFQYHCGDNGEEVPPVPIPNTEVKLFSAESTWPETAREDMSLPHPNKNHPSGWFLFGCGNDIIIFASRQVILLAQ